MRVHAALIAGAVAAALTPTSAAVVERWYSNGIFPRLQPVLTSVSNVSAVAFLDVLILLAVLTTAVVAIRRILVRRTRAQSATRGLVRAVSAVLGVAAALYLMFLVGWGLNYRRVPLVQRVRFDAGRLSVDHARALALESIVRLNALYEPAHAGRQTAPYAFDQELADAFHIASGGFGVLSRTILPRPKRTLLDGYFRRAGVAGMTDPFFLEALIATDLLLVERPFVIAHEWSHVAGLADEGEANFAGWLTCLRGTPAHQYSGWLFAYGELVGSLGDRDRRAVDARLAPGPRSDLLAIRNRLRRHINPRVSAAGWRVYDRYLKANGVSSGTASYSEVVRLMLGADVEAVSRSQPGSSDQRGAPPNAASNDRTPIAAVSAVVLASP
jgi:hypothetical protein